MQSWEPVLDPPLRPQPAHINTSHARAARLTGGHLLEELMRQVVVFVEVHGAAPGEDQRGGRVGQAGESAAPTAAAVTSVRRLRGLGAAREQRPARSGHGASHHRAEVLREAPGHTTRESQQRLEECGSRQSSKQSLMGQVLSEE